MTLLYKSFLLLFGIIAAVLSGPGRSAGAAANEPPSLKIAGLRIGFQGKYKVGHWTPVWVRLTSGSQKVVGRVGVTVLDGDGVNTRTVIDNEIAVPAQKDLWFLLYVKPGRISSGLTVEFMRNSKVIATRKFGTADLPKPASSTSNLIVVAGQDVGVRDALPATKRKSTAIAIIEDLSMLPDEWFGYEAVDTLVLTTSRLPQLLRQLTPIKVRAIRRWVSMGGRLIVCIGRNGEQLIGKDGQGRLASLVPGTFKRIVTQRRLSYVEIKKRQLEGRHRYTATELTGSRGFTDTYLKTGVIRASQNLDLVVRAPFAFGQITFVAVDLDEAPFSKWTNRWELVKHLLNPGSSDRSKNKQKKTSGKVAHLGYKDISGQLRAAMDQFEDVRPFSFFGVVALLIVYILLIGPADYFLLKKFARRMEWTWVTFPLIAASFGGLCFLLAGWWRSGDVHVNQVEIIDIDAESAAMRGTVWAHIYSPEAREYDLSFSPKIADSGKIDDVLLTWQGLPGDGLGGMNTQTSMQRIHQPYTILATQQPGWSTTMQGVPIQVSSSKTVVARWLGKSTLVFKSSLTARQLERGLRGSFTNPLPVSLHSGTLFYGDSAYRLDENLAAGQSIQVNDLVVKALEGYLTQKRIVESEDVKTRWDRTDRDIPRILEMMMFHEAAGGDSYTELTNRYQAYSDLSDHLKLGRAVLIGYTNERSGVLESGKTPLTASYDKDRQYTFYRIVFPVKIKK